MNQSRPHCVNQMGKTHSKPSAARHGRGKAWARHGHSMLRVNRPLHAFMVWRRKTSCEEGLCQEPIIYMGQCLLAVNVIPGHRPTVGYTLQVTRYHTEVDRISRLIRRNK